MYSAAKLDSLVPVPAPNAHKYSRGKAVVVAGNAKYPGAACLAAHACQLAGAGYTQVFTAKRNCALVQAYRPSLVVQPFASYNPERLFSEGNPGALIIGPGFDSSSAKAETLLAQTVRSVQKPLLIDGGALSFLSKKTMRRALERRAKAGLATVLTPHLGEAFALGSALGIDVRSETPQSAAIALAKAYCSVVVLKGPETIIASESAFECMAEGTSVLSKAGTGDVLAGLIGGFIAQGVDPFDACVLGTTVHARAGLEAQHSFGIVSSCAEEVLAGIPAVLSGMVARAHANNAS